MEQDIIAVFPLPNVIFFPHTELPLHIFEPRYCRMIRDTIETRQLIGMFLLQPGWEDDYYGNPPIFSTGCAGEMIRVENLAEGKFNIVLRGIARVQALETIQELPYRKVRVHVLPDIVSQRETRIQNVKRELIRKFKVFGRYMETQTLQEDWEFSRVVNEIASALPLDLELKRSLLEEVDVYARALIVQAQLERMNTGLRLTGRFAHLRPVDPNRN
jgi:Lon protease-like protein